ncbi:MAG: oxygen-independent coproporphyrinogen III oxidase [Acidobacteria bacterium]|nr:oxygen-independent coproporphyrinogen III oxidase [Acidobacteriota bacterium]
MTDSTSYELTLNGEHHRLTLDILNKYNVQGPRYTSYPTAPEWTDAFDLNRYEQSLAEVDALLPRRPLSLYFHLPFCESLCLFCGCNVVIRRDKQVSVPYLQRLEQEIVRMSRWVGSERNVVQLHWGGGTPTYLTPGQAEELFGVISDRFHFAPDAEIGIEVDPRVTTEEHVRVLRRLGFNRISMGVQDFNPKVQQTVHRIQPYELTRNLVELCRELGFGSINLDLIYGLPYQTPESFADSVEKVIRISPNRVAMYSYAHVPWLKKQQGSFARHLPEGLDKFKLFQTGIRLFTEAGYRYIGMDHFAKPDDELAIAQDDKTLHRNFQGYSTRAHADLYAMGVSAISSVGRVYAQNHRDLDSYYRALDEGRAPAFRGCTMTDDDVLRRALITRMLCHRMISKPELEAEFGVVFDDYFHVEQAGLEVLEKDGLITRDELTISATPLGAIFLRNIAMVFDRYLGRKGQEQLVFSRTL